MVAAAAEFGVYGSKGGPWIVSRLRSAGNGARPRAAKGGSVKVKPIAPSVVLAALLAGPLVARCAAGAPQPATRPNIVFLTGRYQQRVGGLECAIGTGNIGRYDDAARLRQSNDLGLPVEETSLARMLNGTGYATAIAGKWHLGYEPKFAPHLHGFERTLYCIGGGMDYFHYLDNLAGYNLFVDGNPVCREGYFTDMVADEAIRFIGEQHDHPFFAYVAFTAPHSPFQAPGDRQHDPLPLNSPLWDQGKAPPEVYIAMIERMDQCIGAILATLDERRLREKTVVFFAGDNGGTRSARNAPLSGIKGTTMEGGIRVPGIVRWPGVIPPGTTSEQVCATFDFSASILRIAGARVPEGRNLDGIDVSEQNDLLERLPAEAERLRGLLADWEKQVQPAR
jgi:arylsulfatase A-like enzyme